jgi:dTDP-4-amino-4,6-dideoxygalactose transaminase
MDPISYVNLSAQWHDEKEELWPIIEAILEDGHYVGGDAVAEFEGDVAQVCGTVHAVALNSGTDAIICALAALNIGSGDEVITPPNSFVASTAAILHVDARPVFVDVLADQNIDPEQIRSAITGKTRAIMPVHLTGRVANMTDIAQIAEHYGLKVIEDAAQAIGSQFDRRASGSWGTIGCFSAHPLKNLNACGDSGFVTTDDETIATKIRLMRNHGLVNRDVVEQFGHVSRMDTLQAAILRFRLKRLPTIIEKRRQNAKTYRTLLDSDYVSLPSDKDKEFNTYHTFVIQIDSRDELRAYLLAHGIPTAIHYPVPIHLQPAASWLGYGVGSFPRTECQAKRILSLPINQYLSQDQIGFIAETINRFFAPEVGA